MYRLVNYTALISQINRRFFANAKTVSTMYNVNDRNNCLFFFSISTNVHYITHVIFMNTSDRVIQPAIFLA